MTVFNGRADLLRLDYRYRNYLDQTEYYVEEEKYAKEIARNLGVTVSNHHWDVNKDQFFKIIKDLSKNIRENAEAGKNTFVYF